MLKEEKSIHRNRSTFIVPWLRQCGSSNGITFGTGCGPPREGCCPLFPWPPGHSKGEGCWMPYSTYSAVHPVVEREINANSSFQIILSHGQALSLSSPPPQQNCSTVQIFGARKLSIGKRKPADEGEVHRRAEIDRLYGQRGPF